MSRPVFVFGAFNPITNAHIDMGVCARRVYPESEIVYIPSCDSYLQGWKNLSALQSIPGSDRYRLLVESLAEYSEIQARVNRCEIDGMSDGKTYTTLSMYQAVNPIICIGADKLSEIGLWYRCDDILSNYDFLVVSRDHTRGELSEYLQKYSDHFTYVDGEYQEVSSSMIRKAWYEGKLDSVKEYIPECVYRYLIRNGR